jgi:hypothetical protein
MPSSCACLVVLVICLSRILGGADFAQPLRQAPSRVQLKISADPDLKSQIQEAMEAELSALPVTVVRDQSPDYTISVIALKVVNQTGRYVGATFSVVVTEPLAERIRRVSESQLTTEAREQLSILLPDVVRLRAHWVETASAGDVSEVSRAIVQSFARDVLKAAKSPDTPSGEAQTHSIISALQSRAALSISSRRQAAWAASVQRKPRESRRRSERT